MYVDLVERRRAAESEDHAREYLDKMAAQESRKAGDTRNRRP